MASIDAPKSNADDLTSSLADNLVISSSTETTNQPIISSEQPVSNIETEEKKSSTECDIKPSETQDFHLIKWIEFNYEHLPILLQNVNGPCPLLAIFNILLLRKRVRHSFRIRTQVLTTLSLSPVDYSRFESGCDHYRTCYHTSCWLYHRTWSISKQRDSFVLLFTRNAFI